MCTQFDHKINAFIIFNVYFFSCKHKSNCPIYFFFFFLSINSQKTSDMSGDADERTPLMVNSEATDAEGKQINSTKAAAGDKEFSFKNIDRRKTFILIAVAFVNFCGTTCFSLLAPFFPQEVL